MNFARVPRVRKISLALRHKAGCDDRRYIVLEMALLRLLTGKTPEPIFAERPDSELEVRRHQCVGTKLCLTRPEDIGAFLTKTCLFAFGRDEEFSGLPHKLKSFKNGLFTFDVKSILLFPEIEPFFDIFETIPSIRVTLITNARGYHVACDPERMPLSDYWWLQRGAIPLKKTRRISSSAQMDQIQK